MGRVRLPRLALKLRMPALLEMQPEQLLEAALLTELTICLAEVQS